MGRYFVFTIFFKVRGNFFADAFWLLGGGLVWYIYHQVEREVANQNIFTRLNIYGFPADLFPLFRKGRFTLDEIV